MKRFLGKENTGALSAVSVIEDGVQKELTAKRDIKDACYIENKQKLEQIVGTPVMRGKLMQDLGFLGNTQACEQILKGEYELLQDIDLITKEFIKDLKRILALEDTPKAIITTEMFKRG